MEYINVKDSIVVELVSCSFCPTGNTWLQVNLEGGIRVGDDIRMYDNNWNLKPVEQLVNQGFIRLKRADSLDLFPAGTILEKVKDNMIVRKTDYDFANEGVIKLMPLEYLDHTTEEIKLASSVEELLELNQITKTKAEDLKSKEIRDLRSIELEKLDSIVTNPLRWESFNKDEKQDFSNYRQMLLDISKQPDFPWHVKWPNKPKELK